MVVVVKKNRRRGAQGYGLPSSRAESSHVQMHVKGASEMHMNPLGRQEADEAETAEEERGRTVDTVVRSTSIVLE